MGNIRKPDTFVKSLLENNLQNYEMKNDKAMIKIQTNILNVIGPQTKLWSDYVELTMKGL